MSETIILTGNVGTVPETRQTPRGPVTNFRIAVNRRRQDPATGSWVDAHTSWYRVAAWRQLGRNASASVKVGDRVLVVGRIKVEEFRRADGSSGTSVEIDADAIGHDLNFATAAATKTALGQRTEHAEATEPEPATEGHDTSSARPGEPADDDGAGRGDASAPDAPSADGPFPAASAFPARDEGDFEPPF